MNLVKKLIFAPFFLIFFIILLITLSPIFKSYDFIFSLSPNTLTALITISILIMLTSFSFVLFATIALDWKLILGTGMLASLAPMVFFNPAVGLILGVGIFASLLLVFVTLENNMKSYLTFQPTTLFGPSIRNLTGFLILSISLAYFVSVNTIIAQKGFQVPDSLIDTALKITQGESTQQTSTAPKDLTRNLIKETIKDQLQTVIKPYINFVAPALAVLLFLTLQSLTSLINLLIYPLLWIIFYILEKSGFIKYTEEMRPVKKIVI